MAGATWRWTTWAVPALGLSVGLLVGWCSTRSDTASKSSDGAPATDAATPLPPTSTPSPSTVAVPPPRAVLDVPASRIDAPSGLPSGRSPFDLSPSGGTLAGTARGADGRPLGARWLRFDRSGDGFATDTLTAPDGSFRLRGLPAGSYRAKLMDGSVPIAVFGPQLHRVPGGAGPLVIRLAR